MRKIGIIDIGSNTARLLLVRVYDNGCYKVFNQLKESIRLGQDMGDECVLKPRRILQTIKTLEMFKRLCEANGVTEIYPVATAAVRKAANQRSFLDEVHASVGLDLKVLSGDEEATIVYQGVVNTLNVDNAVIMDIGGGSTKLIHIEKRQMKNKAVIPYGTINLTDMFDLSDKVHDKQIKLMEEFINKQLDEVPWLAACQDLPLVGVGGSFRNLGKIVRRKQKYPLDITHGYTFSNANVDEVYNGIKKLDLDRRMKIKGLSNERADIFLGAVATVKAVMARMNSNKVILSGAGLRDGLILQQILPSITSKPVDSVLDFSIENILNNMDVNVEHCKRVFSLSASMFEQLKQLHKLPLSYEAIVKAAAMLHDSGIDINYYNHHRHSLYFILNSGLRGLTHRELIMSAFAAAAHRKGELPKDFIKYTELLTNEDLVTVSRIGVLLRIAESFDRSMDGIIQSVSCDVLGDSVIMKTQAVGEASLEIKDALSANDIFKKAFDKNLVIL